MADDNKWAIKTIQENSKGVPQEVFIDADSGQQIKDLKGYQVMDSGDIPNYDSYDNPFNSMFSSKASNYNVEMPVISAGRERPEDEDHERFVVNKDMIPSASNNFRYINKPSAALGIISRLPGIAGPAATAVGTMMGIQNTHATAKAREYLGLEPNYVSNGIRNLAGDPNGFIGDVTIGDKTYAVGLGAQDNKDRTTLTPDEARKRAMTQGATIRDATKQEKKASMESFKTNEELSPEAGALSQNIFDGAMAAAETDRAVQRAPVNNSSYDTARALGIGDLPAREMAGLSYDLGGKGRNQIPSSGIGNKVQGAVTDVLGKDYSVNVTSGMEPEGRSPVGSTYRHPEGFAADLDIRDPQGRQLSLDNPADKQKIKDVAQAMAAQHGANFGMGQEYMGANTMHIDTMDLSKYPGGAQWASQGKAWANDLNTAREYALMPDSYYDQAVGKAPVPEQRPAFSPDSSLVAQATEPQATASLGSNVGIMDRKPMPTYDEAMSATERFKDLTPEERSKMANTLAGEIDPSKTDLTSPTGRQEAMGILSTMENRLGKYGTISDVISAPNQYSTWNNAAASNTAMKNYGLNPDVYDGLVNDYVSDPKNNLGFTSYHANTVSPGWSGAMSNKTTLGAHTFGSLPEYQARQPAIDQGAQSFVSPHTAFNTSATSAPAANSGTGFASMENANKSLSEKSQSVKDNTSKTSQDSTSSKSTGTSGGGGSKDASANTSSKSANSSGSPDDRDSKSKSKF